MSRWRDFVSLVKSNVQRKVKNTCSLTAAARHLGVLQWARANGCPRPERSARACSGVMPMLMLQGELRMVL
eukprot:COSAG02_NODE_315_length_24910_cov_17.139978_21_plen_71_part_00